MIVVKLFLLLVVLAVLVVVGFWVALAVRSKRDYTHSNEVVPGLKSRAPKNWAGANSPEAKLHRRLRDIVVALRAIPGLEGAPGRIEVEQLSLSLDERLVAVAALPASQRAEPLARVTDDVSRLEAAVGELTTQIVAERVPVDRALAGLSQQLGYLAQARAELDAMSAPSQLDIMAARLNPSGQAAPVLPPQAQPAPGYPPSPYPAAPGVVPPPAQDPAWSQPQTPATPATAWSQPSEPVQDASAWPQPQPPVPSQDSAAWQQPQSQPSQDPNAWPQPAQPPSPDPNAWSQPSPAPAPATEAWSQPPPDYAATTGDSPTVPVEGEAPPPPPPPPPA
jgi:hypothetical protein